MSHSDGVSARAVPALAGFLAAPPSSLRVRRRTHRPRPIRCRDMPRKGLSPFEWREGESCRQKHEQRSQPGVHRRSRADRDLHACRSGSRSGPGIAGGGAFSSTRHWEPLRGKPADDRLILRIGDTPIVETCSLLTAVADQSSSAVDQLVVSPAAADNRTPERSRCYGHAQCTRSSPRDVDATSNLRKVWVHVLQLATPATPSASGRPVAPAASSGFS